MEEKSRCAMMETWSNRVIGWLDLILFRMGVMPMKNHFDFKDLMTFGLSFPSDIAYIRVYVL